MNLYQLKYIETPRLLIRPVQLGDEVLLHESIERSIVALERWMPWARGNTFSATKEFIQRGYEHWQAGISKDFPLLVIHKESQKVISVSGYNQHSNLIKPCFEIGYWIDSTFVGQGLATELVNALTRYALDALKAIRVQICTQPENVKSTAVALRCGYVFEAMLRNICLDCVSRLPSDGQLFSCCDISVLPELDLKWEHDLESLKDNQQENKEESVEENKRLRFAQALPNIHTKRLFIRGPKVSDSEKFYMGLNSSLQDAAIWFSWLKKNMSQEEIESHLREGERVSNDILAAEELFFLVFDRDKKKILGEIFLNMVDWAVPNTRMAFWFDLENIGNHDISDALFEVVRFAFSRRNSKCIQLYIPEENIRYTKLLRRLGFRKEGVLKNYFKNYLTQDIYAAEAYSMTEFSQLKK